MTGRCWRHWASISTSVTRRMYGVAGIRRDDPRLWTLRRARWRPLRMACGAGDECAADRSESQGDRGGRLGGGPGPTDQRQPPDVGAARRRDQRVGPGAASTGCGSATVLSDHGRAAAPWLTQSLHAGTDVVVVGGWRVIGLTTRPTPVAGRRAGAGGQRPSAGRHGVPDRGGGLVSTHMTGCTRARSTGPRSRSTN